MGKGHEMATYRDPEMSKKAVSVQVDTLPYYSQPKPFDWTPQTALTVKMTNNGAQTPRRLTAFKGAGPGCDCQNRRWERNL